MGVTVEKLIGRLPPYRDEWVMIHPNQTVKDIMGEVCEAHSEFAPYYDKISKFFDGSSTDKICDNIGDFLRDNLHYTEETEKKQTSALPTGILIRGSNKKIGIDCKHYSGMAAGILDSLNRSGKKIDWYYRFASYKILDSTPHHVFVVVKDKGEEIWIDPTPGSESKDPVWHIDKKVKVSDMALHRNIGGFEIEDLRFTNDQWQPSYAIGKRPQWQLMPLAGARSQPNAQGPGPTNKYFSGPFLGLEFYSEDPLSIEGTNWNVTADAINAAIQQGPAPGHRVDGSFVKWIYEANVKGWNFYYPFGVAPGYKPSLPSSYLQLVITPDGRLTFDRDYPIDDYKNDEIHALTAWAQALINEMDPTPYPLKPQHLKEFSQLKYGNTETRNLFTERRGASFFKEVKEAMVNTMEDLGNGFLKITGSIPRNAFLALVGLNVFNLAAKLQDKITVGKWEEIAEKWRKLGGNPEKLLNTINDGKSKPPVEDKNNTIGELATVAGILAAAAPIIAAMLKFLDKDGKITEVLSAAKGVIAAKFPDLDLSAYGFLDKKTGKEIEFVIDPKDDENKGGGDNKLPSSKYSFSFFDDMQGWVKNNPLMAAGIALAAWELLAPKKMRLINK